METFMTEDYMKCKTYGLFGKNVLKVRFHKRFYRIKQNLY